MCRFKSGIILKNKVVVAPGENESHSGLLDSLGIIDDYFGATRTFVRAELVPDKNEWWVSPEEEPGKWKFVVDQDITPEWFDKKEYEKVFREAVCEWWKKYVLVDQKIEKLNSGFYRLKRCEVKKLCNDVMVMLDNSTVSEMLDNSTVSEMLDNSTVSVMLGNSTVSKMLGNSTVSEMWGNSTVSEMLDNSTVSKMLDNSTVSKMWDNSTVSEMRDNSTVSKMRGNSTVSEMLGNSTVSEMLDNSTVSEMLDNSTVSEMWDNSTVSEMRDNSTVSEMRDNSTVSEMLGNSTVRDFKNYPKVKILVSEDGSFEMMVHKNEK